jgi:predicted PurR-regulated permease PerM
VLVLLVVLALVVALMLVIVPLFIKELRLMAEQLPAFLAWINQQVAPWLKERYAIEFQLDVETFKRLAGSVLASNQDLVASLLGSLRIGGLALIAFLINLLLVPVVLFFLLRDWNSLVARVDAMIPRHLHQRAGNILAEIDAVLAEFLRGQLTVMLLMSVYYSTALWVAGLEFALPIGIITGLLVIIPYVGAFTGILLGTIAAAMQFNSLAGVAWVWLAFGIGQALEGTMVTPLLVGKRIGLHPVAVIFALLAFGQIFGFFGVLLALPASAVLLVTLRRLQKAYLAGPLYGGPK